MERRRGSRMRAWACVWGLSLMPALGPVALAEPMRLSVDGRADPGPASAAASVAGTARFVAVNPAAAASAGEAGTDAVDEGEREFVPSLALPRRETASELALPPPDETQGQLRLLGGDGATAVPPALPEQRRLGAFGRRDAGGEEGVSSLVDGDAGDGDAGDAADAEDAFALASDPPDRRGASAAAAPLPGAPEGAALGPGHTRMVSVFIVVPLVLAAMVMLWRLDRGGRHRRRRSSGARATDDARGARGAAGTRTRSR